MEPKDYLNIVGRAIKNQEVCARHPSKQVSNRKSHRQHRILDTYC